MAVRDQIRKYRRLLAVLAALLLIGLSWLGIYFIEDARTSWTEVFAVTIHLASTVIAFLVASLLFDKENEDEQRQLIKTSVSELLPDEEYQRNLIRGVINESVAKPEVLSQVPWQKLLEESSEVDFVVQGWDGWAEYEEVAQSLSHFFNRGGIFRLYICSPDSTAASQNRVLMEKRLSRSPADIVSEITGTIRNIEEVISEACAGAQLEIVESNNLNWYFAALFKGRATAGQSRTRDVLVFSVYSHTPRRPWAMPAIVIYPDMYGDAKMYEWFELELAHLRAGSTTRRVVPSGARL